MKRLLMATAAAIGLFATSAQAFQAAPQPFQPNLRDSKTLECAIVAHTPDRDRNPPYKVTVTLGMDDGVFQSLDVCYTLVNGREVSRTDQYQDGRTWTETPRLKSWYWSGTHRGVAGRPAVSFTTTAMAGCIASRSKRSRALSDARGLPRARAASNRMALRLACGPAHSAFWKEGS